MSVARLDSISSLAAVSFEEKSNFRKMIIASVVGHALLFAFIFILNTRMAPRRNLAITPGPINVMWARTVSSPNATPSYKLPAPKVRAIPKAKDRTADPKLVLRKRSRATRKKEREDLETLARRREMAAALSDLQQDLEKKPTPRPNNFPSQGKGARSLYPAGPQGGGNVQGNPAFTGYLASVRQIITDNFVWIQKKDQLRAEVTFQIDGEGNILRPDLTQSSGNNAYDGAALRAVRKSSPLPLPPATFLDHIVSEPLVVRFDPNSK